MVAKGDCGDHGGRLICPQDKALRRKSFLVNPAIDEAIPPIDEAAHLPEAGEGNRIAS